MKTAEAAKGKWRGILLQFGVEERVLNGRHQFCPLCQDGKDRFRYSDVYQNGDYYCSVCGPGDGFQYIEKAFGIDFKAAAKRIDGMVNNISTDPEKPKHDPMPLLKYVANNAGHGPEVVKYIRARGLQPNRLLKQVKLNYYEDGKKVGEYFCMAGLVVDKDNLPVTYHITYLEHGKKADVPSPKKVLPGKKSINGCAVRLGTGSMICITEGIETALAVTEMTKLPVWAALNTGCMEKLEFPEEVKKVLIYGDNDENYAGQKAAYVLANKIKTHKDTKHIIVEVNIPEKTGTDWLDYYQTEYHK